MLRRPLGRRTTRSVLWTCLILASGAVRAQSPAERELLRHAASGRLVRCTIRMPVRPNRDPALIEADIRDEASVVFEIQPLPALLIADTIAALTGDRPEILERSPTYDPWISLLSASACVLGVLGCALGVRHRAAAKQMIDVEPIDRPSLSDRRWPYLNTGHLAADAAVVLGGLGAVGLLAFLHELLPGVRWLGEVRRIALLFSGIVAFQLLLWGLHKLPRWGVAGGGALWNAARAAWIAWCVLCLLGAAGYLVASKQATVPISQRIEEGPPPQVLLARAVRGEMERLVYADWYALGGDSLRMKRLGNRLSGRLADGATFERIVDADSGRLLLEISEEKGIPIEHEGVEREPVALDGVFLRVPPLYMNSVLPLGGIVISLFALALTNHRPLLFPLAGFSLHAALGLLASLPIGASNPLPAPVELLWTPLSSLALLAFVCSMPTKPRSVRPQRQARRKPSRARSPRR